MMTRRTPRVAAEMPLARISGSRWVIAMCEVEWDQLSHGLPAATRDRLLAILLHFCDEGERHLPKGSFHWISPDSANLAAAPQGAFEARGVVLSGRAAIGTTPSLFVVTQITIDTPSEPTQRRAPRRNAADARQSRLPFNTVS